MAAVLTTVAGRLLPFSLPLGGKGGTIQLDCLRGSNGSTVMNEVDTTEIADSLKRRVDQSWGDSTERFGWRDELEYLRRVDPDGAGRVQLFRDRAHHRQRDYEFFWAEQKRLRREARR